MKSVDVIVPYFYPPYIGGTETVLRKWKQYFKDTDGDLKVRFIQPFAYRDSQLLSDKDGLRIRPFNNKLMKYIGLINLAADLIFTKSDMVIVLSPKYIRLSYKIRRIFHKKYRITNWIHFSLTKMFVNNDKYFRLADYHLAISTGIKQQLLDMGISDEKINTVFNRTDSNCYQIKASKVPKYIYVGRLEYQHQKNLQELIHAFCLVRKKFPDATLELWGNGLKKDTDQIKTLVKQLQLGEVVLFKGWYKNPWKEIDSATAFVLTSTYEGLPMSILEAMSHGIPVISSNISTGPEDEITRENGMLYHLGDVEELKNKMLEVYQKDYSQEKITQSINRFYSENYFANLVRMLQEMG